MNILVGIVMGVAALILLFFMAREALDDARDSASVESNLPLERFHATTERFGPRRRKLRRLWLLFTSLSVAVALACTACLFLFLQEENKQYYQQNIELSEGLLIGGIMLFFVSVALAAVASAYGGKLKALDRARNERREK